MEFGRHRWDYGTLAVRMVSSLGITPMICEILLSSHAAGVCVHERRSIAGALEQAPTALHRTPLLEGRTEFPPRMSHSQPFEATLLGFAVTSATRATRRSILAAICALYVSTFRDLNI